MALKIVKISKRIVDRWILRDVSLEVSKGEIFGLFGATGEGKSLFLKIAAGHEKPHSGHIFDDSRDVTELNCEKRGFYFPQISNKSFWKGIFGGAKKSELADGEGQILALENALQNAQGVLLLDNSFCYLDRKNREESYAKLRRTVQEKNLTVIFATNDYEAVFLVCDRVAILSNSEIRQTGTPREIYENPVSSTVAGLTGRNNLLAARRLSSTKTEIPEFQTLTGEHRLFAKKTDKQRLGAINQNITLAIRPEHISISFGASFPEDNLLRAKVSNVQFLGGTTLIELDSNGLKLEALVLRLVGLNIGDECMVGLPPDRILVLRN